MNSPEHFNKIFRKVPDTGVIYVMNKALNSGYSERDREWVNLGQGQPQVGRIKGAPPRLSNVNMKTIDLEYAPVSGLNDLKLAVADYYNYFYRREKTSKYTPDNVSISPGGRSSLTRVITALSSINMGHFLPDYTAYEELLGSFGKINTIPIPLGPDSGYSMTARQLREEIVNKDISAILLSNPCNPTGRVISGQDLSDWRDVAEETNCFMIFDEFYGHYVWGDIAREGFPGISSAEYIKDVNQDPIIVVDGVTKNWRYPGARISWTLGPAPIIRAINSAGSFIDGGAARPMQAAAIKILDKKKSILESSAIRTTFAKKRKYAIKRLRAMGIGIPVEPEGTFYIWCDLSDLPSSINTGMKFFENALNYKVICVPGQFFDIDPGGRRIRRSSRYEKNLRISCGPKMSEIKRGLDNLDKMILDHKKA